MYRANIDDKKHQYTHSIERSTKNRKHKSKRHTYTFRGDTYIVDARCEGIYTPILKAILEVLYAAKERWGRVLVIRFDLHHKGIHTTDNAHVSKFIKNLQRKLERKYQTKAFYTWAREVGRKEEGQHYHLALFIDANKVKSSYKVLDIAEKTWSHSLFRPRNPYYFINTPTVMQDAVYRLSYLAKVATKGKRKAEVHDFGRSQLNRSRKR